MDRSAVELVASQRQRGLFILDAAAGEARPSIAIAAALTRRGHACQVVAQARFGDVATYSGAQFLAVEASPALSSSPPGGESEPPPGMAVLEKHFARLDRARPTIVVSTESNSASCILAERHEMGTVQLYLSPTCIRTRSGVTWPLRARVIGHLGQTFAKYQLPQLVAARDRDPRSLARLNRTRLLLGLPPALDLRRGQQRAVGHLAVFPKWYSEPGSDWSQALEYVGFFTPAAQPNLPRELERLVVQEGRPIVFLPSTAERHGFPNPAHCCQLLRVPGVVFGPSGATLLGSNGAQLDELETLDLDAAISKAALLVHAGDTLPMANALRRGVPQILIPSDGEQPDNAQRMFNLGVGRVLTRTHASVEALAQTARALFESASVKEAVRALSERVANEGDSAERAADAIERQLWAAKVPSEADGQALRTEVLCHSPVSAATETQTAPRTVVFLVWSEPGHLAVPLALARRLVTRGDRVVLACMDGQFAPKLLSLGYEVVDLSRVPAGSIDETAVAPASSTSEQLRIAATRLALAFESLVECYRPSVVLIDTLYSTLGVLAEGAGVPWAIYETDLMREYDPLVPPRAALVIPGRAGSTERIRDAWLALLRERRREEGAPAQTPPFPRDMIEALQHRHGVAVRFERHLSKPPVARAPKLVFAPRAFDFPRSRTSGLATWVGPCIDDQRCEPDFAWGELPDKPLVYCAFGTQSLRDGQAPRLLELVAQVFRDRDDFFAVIVCPEQHRPPSAEQNRNVLLVNEAPQLALLRRAQLAITHAGFNSVKECAAYGVPMIALPLSQEQPRNAALVELHGLGVAFDTSRHELTAAELDTAVAHVARSGYIRDNCQRMRQHFADSGFPAALQFIDALASRAVCAKG